MLRTIWDYILGVLGRAPGKEEKQAWIESQRYAARFEDRKRMNFTAIFAGKLATLALGESTADITGRGGRSAFLEQCLKDIWPEMKRVTSRMLGTGGCVAVPYVRGGRLYFDLLSQERMTIHEKEGRRITWATLLAERITIKERHYFRWVDYKVINGVLFITNKVTDELGRDAVVSRWQGIEDRAIHGVDRVLFAYFKSPTDSRRFGNPYGVPITYGCEGLMEEIYNCLEEIEQEYELKQVRAFADERMFKRDIAGNPIMPDKLFRALRMGDGDGGMLEIFSPEIRDSSYYNRLMQLFDLLEKAVGTSRGILTAPESRGATATEIKAGLYDTFAMIADIRFVLEEGIREYLFACDVLANYFALTPKGSFEISFDWSYSLVESSAETWAQLKDAYHMGIKSKGEIRQWLNPNESADEAAMRTEEIGAFAPSLDNRR